jgi:hypothetical protein
MVVPLNPVDLGLGVPLPAVPRPLPRPRPRPPLRPLQVAAVDLVSVVRALVVMPAAMLLPLLILFLFPYWRSYLSINHFQIVWCPPSCRSVICFDVDLVCSDSSHGCESLAGFAPRRSGCRWFLNLILNADPVASSETETDSSPCFVAVVALLSLVLSVLFGFRSDCVLNLVDDRRLLDT